MGKITGRVQGLEPYEFELINAPKGSINLHLKGAEQIEASDSLGSEGLNFHVMEKFMWASQVPFPFIFGVAFTTTSPCCAL